MYYASIVTDRSKLPFHSIFLGSLFTIFKQKILFTGKASKLTGRVHIRHQVFIFQGVKCYREVLMDCTTDDQILLDQTTK